jgi:putative ABC transport system substrate-binding protein
MLDLDEWQPRGSGSDPGDPGRGSMSQPVRTTVRLTQRQRGHRPSRRRFLRASAAVASLGLLAGCSRIPSLRPSGPRRIGALSVENPVVQSWMATWEKRLTELGQVRGERFIVEARVAPDNDGFDALVKELLDKQVDVIMAAGWVAMDAAKRHTSTVPIVGISSDPIGTGLVQSFQRPGGNITGLTTLSVPLAAKRVEYFRETIPGLQRTGVMWNSLVPDRKAEFTETEKALATLKMDLLSLPVQRPADFIPAFEEAKAWRADGLILLFDQMTFPAATANAYSPDPNIDPLAYLMAKYSTPAVCDVREWAEGSGGLTTYGPDFPWLFTRAAEMTDKILMGTRPADIPIEQPSDFILTINLDVARQMNITIPETAQRLAHNIYQKRPS